MPIGTILAYVGPIDQIPSGWYLCDGSHGTPNLTDRFLEGTDTNVRKFVESGLPNITGTFMGDDGNNGINKQYATGAFSVLGSVGGDGDNSYGFLFSFDASRSNLIYGKSNTVQPAAYTVYFIIKI